MKALSSLEDYLNHHLSGSSAALDLLETLEKSDEVNQNVFRNLRLGIGRNREVLEGILEKSGFDRSLWQEAASHAMSVLGQLPLKLEGLKTGSLGMLEALEMLELGITGQILLWRSLEKIEDAHPEWAELHFPDLIDIAEDQKRTVETLRMQTIAQALG